LQYQYLVVKYVLEEDVEEKEHPISSCDDENATKSRSHSI